CKWQQQLPGSRFRRRSPRLS
ncbi:MAG: hypothetical protein AVDCRST_MAG88-4019, partial [uncultured Thermomicrobiales bacterium]